MHIIDRIKMALDIGGTAFEAFQKAFDCDPYSHPYDYWEDIGKAG
jgi:hypothetical protein